MNAHIQHTYSAPDSCCIFLHSLLKWFVIWIFSFSVSCFLLIYHQETKTATTGEVLKKQRLGLHSVIHKCTLLFISPPQKTRLAACCCPYISPLLAQKKSETTSFYLLYSAVAKNDLYSPSSTIGFEPKSLILSFQEISLTMESNVEADWTATGFHLKGGKIPISGREITLDSPG